MDFESLRTLINFHKHTGPNTDLTKVWRLLNEESKVFHLQEYVTIKDRPDLTGYIVRKYHDKQTMENKYTVKYVVEGYSGSHMEDFKESELERVPEAMLGMLKLIDLLAVKLSQKG